VCVCVNHLSSSHRYNVLSSVVSTTTPSVFVVLLRSIIKYAGLVGQMDKLHNYFNNLDGNSLS